MATSGPEDNVELSEPSNPKPRGRPTKDNALKAIQEALNLLTFKIQTLETKMEQNQFETQIENFSTPPPRPTAKYQDDNSTVLSQFLKMQEGNHFLQISQMLIKINGKESPQELANYFRTFESHTEPFSDSKKVSLLITKLEGKALTIYNTLSDLQKNDYFAIKEELIKGVHPIQSRYLDQTQLLSGIPKRTSESMTEYARRVVEKIRSSLLPETPETVIFDLAKTQFINSISDQIVKSTLLIHSSKLSYYELVNEAETLSSIIPREQQPVRAERFPPPTNRFSAMPSNRFVPPSSRVINRTPNHTLVVTPRKQETSTCLFCERNHPSCRCTTYSEIYARIRRLTELNRCTKCVKRGHTTTTCRSQPRCTICSGEHSFLVCDNPPSARSTNTIAETGNVTLAQAMIKSQVNDSVLLKCVNCTVINPEHPHNQVTALVLLDDGSTTSYISTSLVRKLKLKPILTESSTINVFNDPAPKHVQTDIIEFSLLLDSGTQFKIKGRSMNYLSQFVPHALINTTELNPYVPVRYTLGSPDILIGGDYYYDLSLSYRKQLPSGYCLFDSLLGPILAGKGKADNQILSVSTNLVSTFNAIQDSQNLDTKVNEFFSLDNIGITDKVSEPVDLTSFQRSIKFTKDRYEVSLPWKHFPPELSSNYGLSFGRLRSTLRFFNNKPELLLRYHEVIASQLSNGVIEVADNSYRSVVHYLPHQPVLRKGKIRIVYDASAKIKSANSLNDCLYPGPLLLHNLAGILIRFRLYPVVVLCDIEKAFLQISLNVEDRDAVRFLWIKDPKLPATPPNIITYRFCRVAFGLTCSPFLLASTILNHFENHSSSVSSDIMSNLYVDNILLNCTDTATAASRSMDVKAEFAKIGMNVREFVSNRPEAIAGMKEDDKLKGTRHKVLGLSWDSDKDSVEFLISPPPATNQTTKQSMLSYIASQFDPLGLLSPAMLSLKTLFQTLWEQKLEWNEPVPTATSESWYKFFSDCPVKLAIPRPTTDLFSTCKHELHAFSDASGYAFSCCVYLRTIYPSSKCKTFLVFCKTKVCPKRYKDNITIHKLELLGLLIAHRSIKFVMNELFKDPILKSTLDPSLLMWTDSSTVLHWLRSSVKQPTFIENRLREIASSAKTIVRYVRTSDNPADIASRGCTFSELQNNEAWWHGPPWLSSAKFPAVDNVPSFSSDENTYRNLSAEYTLLSVSHSTSIINHNRFSSWTKILHTTVYVLRFLKRLKISNKWKWLNEFPAKFTTVFPQVGELQVSREILFRIAQQENPPQSDIQRDLNLFLDSKQLWRSRGRIDNSLITYASKMPIWLPNRNHVTELFIYHTHLLMLHAGPVAVLNQVRLSCWLAQGRRIVRQIIRKYCLNCRKLTVKSFTPIPYPSLPGNRVQPSPPFSHTGVDYIGPMVIQQGKIWIVLFTCLSTRATHLEVTNSLSAESFILTFRRFTSRRGKPTTMISDNGKQFVLAKKVVHPSAPVRNPLLASVIQNYMRDHGVEWTFITERAPWKGGFYERLVGLTKFHLYRTIKNSRVNLDQLTTTITEIEFILNCRPISFVSEEIDNLIPLRPIDLLSPNMNTMLMLPFDQVQRNLFTQNLSSQEFLIDAWKHSLKKLDSFWKSWSQDYLLSLREKTQKLSNTQSQTPKIGEIVLVADENLPRNTWRLARIAPNQTITKDTRSVFVKLSSGRLLKRSIMHLFPLEC